VRGGPAFGAASPLSDETWRRNSSKVSRGTSRPCRRMRFRSVLSLVMIASASSRAVAAINASFTVPRYRRPIRSADRNKCALHAGTTARSSSSGRRHPRAEARRAGWLDSRLRVRCLSTIGGFCALRVRPGRRPEPQDIEVRDRIDVELGCPVDVNRRCPTGSSGRSCAVPSQPVSRRSTISRWGIH
jgi:hypothetical protein